MVVALRLTHYTAIDLRLRLSLPNYYDSPDLPQVSSGNAKGFPQESAKDRMHISFLAGIRVIQRDRDPEKYSGYQVMRLATELVPTYAAILGPRLLSPFWIVLFYLSLILLGLAQQLAITHAVVSGLLAVRPSQGSVQQSRLS